MCSIFRRNSIPLPPHSQQSPQLPQHSLETCQGVMRNLVNRKCLVSKDFSLAPSRAPLSQLTPGGRMPDLDFCP